MALMERYLIERKGRQLLEDYDSPIVKSEVLDFLQALESRTGPTESSLSPETVSWLLRYNYISRTAIES